MVTTIGTVVVTGSGAALAVGTVLGTTLVAHALLNAASGPSSVTSGGGEPLGGGRDYRGLSTSQVKKYLAEFDTEPHAFKEEYVGRSSISKFDVKMGPHGELYLVSKDGTVVIPTGLVPR
jgi:hypothetical protein